MRVIFPVAVALGLMIASQPAVAQDGATVTKDGMCGGFVPTSTGDIGPIIWTTHTVALTKSKGSSSISCHFDVPSAYIPTQTTRAQGFVCNTYLGSTTNSRMQASTGGSATLSCRVRN